MDQRNSSFEPFSFHSPKPDQPGRNRLRVAERITAPSTAKQAAHRGPSLRVFLRLSVIAIFGISALQGSTATLHGQEPAIQEPILQEPITHGPVPQPPVKEARVQNSPSLPSASKSRVKAPLSPSEQLFELFSDVFDQRLELDPSFASSLGDRRFLSRMTVDLDPKWRTAIGDLSRHALKSLDTLDRSALSDREQLFADAFKADHETRLALLDLPNHLLPLTPGWGFTSRFAKSASGIDDLRFQSIDDHEAFLSRVEDLERWVDLAIRNMNTGATKGVVHPRSVVDRMIVELQRQLDAEPMDSVFATPIHRMPKQLGTEEKKIWRRHLKAAVQESILPSYKRLLDYLVQTYRPKTRDTISLAALPGGQDWYGALSKAYTTTDLTPEQIFSLGEQEVARIQKEMKVLSRWLQGRPSQRATQWRGVHSRFEKIDARVKENLPKLFHSVPDAPLEIREVEPFRAPSAGAFYERPAVDGSRPGVFYVDLRRGFDTNGSEALYLHEALPGHHFQIAHAQQSTDLPRFLRFGYFGAYVEGWGLYCESLGKELGLYKAPEQRFGRLQFELGRAARLIADVGIHHFGWTRKEAELELSSRRLQWALYEIDRYVDLPGQALSYKIGELHLLRLRQKAQDRLGKRFDPRDFHQQVLSTGPLPLMVLEEKIDRWLDREINGSS